MRILGSQTPLSISTARKTRPAKPQRGWADAQHRFPLEEISTISLCASTGHITSSLVRIFRRLDMSKECALFGIICWKSHGNSSQRRSKIAEREVCYFEYRRFALGENPGSVQERDR